MVNRRRHDDRYEVPSLVLGVLCILSAVALKLLRPVEDWLVLGLAVLGGVLVPHSRVLDALRALWRKGNGQTS
jgi:hypothetical protein